MPGAVLHLKHAELLCEEPALAEPLRQALVAHRPLTRLGSILPDLPFYTNIVPMMLGYWLERPAEHCVVGQRMHSDHPDQFAWHLLTRAAQPCTPGARPLNRPATDPLEPAQRLALMAGFFSHVALDLEVHPLVNWCARRDVNLYGGHESHHHRLTEKYHSLFFHIDHEGEDCLGSMEFFRNRATIADGVGILRRRDELPLVDWLADVLSFYSDVAPGTRRVAGWLRTFRRFALMVSLPMAASNGQRLGHAEHRRRYYENDDFVFTDFWRRGYERSIELLNTAYDVYARGDFTPQARDAFLSAAQISDLSYPPEKALPPLPIRPVQLEWTTA